MTQLLTTGVLEIGLGRRAAAEPSYRRGPVDCLPEVPALPETVLLMELKSREFSVDLRQFTRLVLRDVGASLQIYRLAAREYGEAEDRPSRMEDCISGLGLEACVHAAAARVWAKGSGSREVLAFWEHSCDVARLCGALAEERDYRLAPDDAYQIGLFHGIGRLPGILGWNSQNLSPQERGRTAARLARQWSLPSCIQEFFAERRFTRRSAWNELVDRAHEGAGHFSLGAAAVGS